MKKYIMLCLLWLCGIAAYTQEIKVQIKDKATQETLELAYAQQQDNERIIQAENGQLTLKVDNTYKLIHQGYQSKRITVSTDTAAIIYLAPKVNVLSEVIVSGMILKDPAMTLSTPYLTENVSQPKNVAELFEGLEGFGIIKRGNYAMDPSFRAAQYEQLNIQYDGGTKVLHALTEWTR
jgi:iron complex outermembrane receptor protein